MQLNVIKDILFRYAKNIYVIIQKHIKTADHKRALQTKTMKPDFDQGVANANQHHEADVTSAMNNLYWMAKHNQPLTIHKNVMMTTVKKILQ